MVANYTEVSQKIDQLATNLIDGIADMRFFDKNKAKELANTYLKHAILECSRSQKTKWEQEHEELKNKINSYKGSEKAKKQTKLSELKHQIKVNNRILASVEADLKDRSMTEWMKKHHPESLQVFYREYDTEKVK